MGRNVWKRRRWLFGMYADAHQSFLDALHYWRTVRRIYVGYDGSRYDLPALQWTQSSFIQPQAMVEDRYLYDPTEANIPLIGIWPMSISAMAA